MRIVDTEYKADLALKDVAVGTVVRLSNGKLYLIGEMKHPFLPHQYHASGVLKRQKLLINLDTGLSHKMSDDANTTCTLVDAELRVPSGVHSE